MQQGSVSFENINSLWSTITFELNNKTQSNSIFEIHFYSFNTFLIGVNIDNIK